MLQIAKLPKENSSKPRTVVITQGAEATIVAKDGKVGLSGFEVLERVLMERYLICTIMYINQACGCSSEEEALLSHLAYAAWHSQVYAVRM